MKYRKCEICRMKTERKDGHKRFFMARFPINEARYRITIASQKNCFALSHATAAGVRVDVEYCRACDYSGHCLALAKTIRKVTPDSVVFCKKGRQGSFEVVVNDKLIYSKLQTMALPDYEEVAEVVQSVSQGAEPTEIKGQQPVNCVIS